MRTDGRCWAGAASALVLASALSMPAAGADVRITEGTNLSVDVAPDGEHLLIDLLGNLWQVSRRGGEAQRLTDSLLAARRPRWSPDGARILFQNDAPEGPQLWRHDLASGQNERLSPVGAIERHGDWHPDGGRIVYAAQHAASGLDLWERDLATGLSWRISAHAGDELAPAWSANGRHLTYVLHQDDRWHLMLQRFAHPATALMSSDTPLYAPAWRPDGTMVTFLQAQPDNSLALQMLILSAPPLLRTLATGEDFFPAAVSWADRDRLYYTADGTIKSRNFDDREARRLRFSAQVSRPEVARNGALPDRPLPADDVPDADLIVRAARLYDGISPQYRHDVDIIVNAGRIEAIDAQRDRGERFVLDLANVTVIPGLIDVLAPMPAGNAAAGGARALAFGVTTLVSPDAPDAFDAALWESAATPGPRLLRAVSAAAQPGGRIDPGIRLAVVQDRGLPQDGSDLQSWRRRGVPLLAENWRVGLNIGADLLLGAALLPASPGGHRYEDVRLAGGNGPLTFVSGLADAATPGLADLLASRQAQALHGSAASARRYAGSEPFGQGGAALVVGSLPSGLPAGLSTQAELRALQAAGVEPARVLHAATGAAARALGLESQLGRVAAGARADLLLIAGDPLSDVQDALNIVAVVRNGRFYSLSALLEQAGVE